MLETGGIFCRVCHMWNDGESDFCSHCQDRLIGSRPLTVRGVDSWLKGQVDEHEVLRIPLSFEDRKLLRRWASFHSVNLIVEADTDEAAVLASRTRELMAEQGQSWKEAWQTAELEWSVSTGLSPTSTHRKKGSKWLLLSAIGVSLPFAASFALVAIAIVSSLFDPNTGVADSWIGGWIVLASLWLGLLLVIVGVVGWLANADNWSDRFTGLARVGAIMICGSLTFAFAMGFSIGGREGTVFFLRWGLSMGFLVALMGSLGYAGVRLRNHRETTRQIPSGHRQSGVNPRP